MQHLINLLQWRNKNDFDAMGHPPFLAVVSPKWTKSAPIKFKRHLTI